MGVLGTQREHLSSLLVQHASILTYFLVGGLAVGLQVADESLNEIFFSIKVVQHTSEGNLLVSTIFASLFIFFVSSVWIN